MNDALPADPLALHRGLLTLDTHIDIPWPTGPDPFLDGPRRVDLPKMQRGGLAAGCFVAYVPQAARTAESEAAAFERAIGMLHAIRGMGRSENGIAARVAVTADEIARGETRRRAGDHPGGGERLRDGHRPVAARAVPGARRALPDADA